MSKEAKYCDDFCKKFPKSTLQIFPDIVKY